MRRIVVGYDGSSSGREALVWASDEARRRRISLQVVVVEDDLPTGMPGHPTGATGADADVVVDEIAHGLRHQVSREHGTPSERLVDACTPDDLLVVGSRGHGMLVGTLMGSASRACLHSAPCPVVVVREAAAPEGPVVVGIDSSEHSRRALAFASEEAKQRDVTLRVVHGVAWTPMGNEFITPSPDELAQWGEHLVATELERAGVTAETVVDPGHPSDALVRASEHAGLLVVGSRGRNPLASLLLGSTSAHCAAHAACPVAVVR
jgi:nucleotide-binding universal stress UspA family protein